MVCFNQTGFNHHHKLKKVQVYRKRRRCGILTNKLVGFLQPRKQLLTVAVVDGNAQEVVVADEVGFGTSVAGIQNEGDSILCHQFLFGKV